MRYGLPQPWNRTERRESRWRKGGAMVNEPDMLAKNRRDIIGEYFYICLTLYWMLEIVATFFYEHHERHDFVAGSAELCCALHATASWLRHRKRRLKRTKAAAGAAT